jgi:hypothetical protein
MTITPCAADVDDDLMMIIIIDLADDVLMP